MLVFLSLDGSMTNVAPRLQAGTQVLGKHDVQDASDVMTFITISNKLSNFFSRVSYTCEIKCRIAMAKVAFNKKRTLFTSTLDLELRKKLLKCYIWSIALYGTETWTLPAVDQKHLESFEMSCWRRMEKISWTDHVRNEDVLIRVKEQRNILHEIWFQRISKHVGANFKCFSLRF
jgi:hypothetical protein